MVTRQTNFSKDTNAVKQLDELMLTFSISDYEIDYKSNSVRWNWEQAIIPDRKLSDLEKSLVSAINAQKQVISQV